MTSPLQQKLKVTGPVVITANRLGDGELLTAALADRLRAVDAYVAPVQVSSEQGVRPGNLREWIRCNGPTVAFPGQR